MGNSWSVLHASKCPLVTAVITNTNNTNIILALLSIIRCKRIKLHSTCCKAVADRARPGYPHPPPPILSFEKWSLDPSGPLRRSNLILSECLYNFETNTFYQAQICIWYTQREKGFSELYLWLSGSRFYTIISNINFQHIDGNSGTYVWVQTAQSIEHANVLSENFYFWASGATFHS